MQRRGFEPRLLYKMYSNTYVTYDIMLDILAKSQLFIYINLRII